MPQPRIKKLATDEPSTTSDIKALSRIETQMEYVIQSLDKLTSQILKFEEQRISNWVEYRTAHEKLVSQSDVNSKRLGEIEGEIVELMQNTEGAIDGLEKDTQGKISVVVSNTETRFGTVTKLITILDEKISPLLFAHKILVWVSIALGSSIAALLWGIFTHTITITFAK